MDPMGGTPKELRPTPSPRATLLMRLLAGKNVPPDSRSFETKYLQLKGVLPFLFGAAVFFAGLIGYLIGSM